MRLIDTDKLIEKFDTDGCALDPIEVRMQILREPTTYNVDKVMEQLEERASFLKCQTEEQRGNSYGTMLMYEVADLVADLIDIVKAGGIDDN